MSIYIPQFVLGIIVTLVVECVALVAYIIYLYKKGKLKDDETT